MTTSNDVRFRWAEILLTMLVSAGGSALAVTWSVSATVTEMKMDVEAVKTKQAEDAKELKDKQAAQDAIISNLSSQAALQTTQIAVSDANYKNIITWLAEIKDELRKKR